MKKIVKFASLFLAASLSLCLCLAGCTDGKTTSGGGSSLPDYDALENELAVTITGWIAPDTIGTEEQMQLVKDVGIDTLFLGAAGEGTYIPNVNSPTEGDRSVYTLMEEYGIRAYLNTGGNIGGFAQIGQYAEYSSVAGLSFDEPNKSEIGQIAAQVDAFNQSGAGKNFYVNLFPSFSTEVRNDFGVGGYRDYLRYYCDNVLEKLTVGEKWLSADRYPLTFDTNGEKALDVGWLQDVEAVANVAREYEGVKTNFFIQTMPYGVKVPAGVQGSHDRVPSYEDIRMQEYALLAFGYDSISLFCYMTPAVGVEFTEEQFAMIDRSGEPTQIYYDAQKANREVLAFDHVYLQFGWQGVFTNDGGTTTADGDRNKTQNSSFSNLLGRMDLAEVAFIDSVTTSEDTLFGYFMDGADNEAVLAVNYNETSLGLQDTVTLHFDPAYGYTKAQCYVGGKEVTYDLTENSLTFTLGAGEGVFVIPY